MATQASTIQFILRQCQSAGVVRARTMFGEYGLYCNDKIVALVCDDILFVKPTDIASHFAEESWLAPPYPGAKDYYAVPPDKLKDELWLTDFIAATAAALPPPKPKKPKKSPS